MLIDIQCTGFVFYFLGVLHQFKQATHVQLRLKDQKKGKEQKKKIEKVLLKQQCQFFYHLYYA